MKVKRRNRSALDSLARQRALLKMEYESGKKEFSDMADRIGIDRLVERGNAWYPLKVGNVFHNA